MRSSAEDMTVLRRHKSEAKPRFAFLPHNKIKR